MSLSRTLKQSLRRKLALLKRDQPAILGFLFHALYKDEAEIQQHKLSPQQGITPEHMRRFIEHFLHAGYTFISPEQDISALDPAGRYLYISFDDGYFNNLRMLPLLDEYAIPATFYITTGNVERGECFWWDVVHRQRQRQGYTHKQIAQEQKQLKTRDHDGIIQYLKDHFGKHCLRPMSDTDRPMGIDELREFATRRGVFIGNHCRDHYLLDRYPPSTVKQQIQRAQDDLQHWLGQRPQSLAYPNGNFSRSAIQGARASGIAYACTLQKHKSHLPLPAHSDSALSMGRFTLWGRDDIEAQCEVFRSDIRL